MLKAKGKKNNVHIVGEHPTKGETLQREIIKNPDEFHQKTSQKAARQPWILVEQWAEALW
jgi:hypothetical protein